MAKRPGSWRAKNRRRTSHQSRPIGSAYRRPLRLEPLEDRNLLTVVTVTTNLDTVDFNDGKLSLREAIFATNLVSGPDEIRFDFGHDGPETILLTQGTIRITGDLTITGPGNNLLTIDAGSIDPMPYDPGSQHNIFHIEGTTNSLIDVTLGKLTLTGGKQYEPIPGNSKSAGGAIFSRANLTILESTLIDNSALYGGAIFASAGSLTIIDSDFSQNWAAYDGGTIGSSQAAIEIVSTTLRENHTFRNGGAIYVQGGSLDITDSELADNNSPGRGGAIMLESIGGYVSASLARTTLVSNRGGIGGAIAGHIGGNLKIEDCTIEQNRAGRGGGIFFDNYSGTLGISRSTIQQNTAGLGGGIFLNLVQGELNVADSVIQQNTAGVGGGIYAELLVSQIHIDSSTIRANVAAESPSDNGGGGQGAGILVHSSSPPHASLVDIRNSTLEDNAAVNPLNSGGAIQAFGAHLVVESSTLSGNTAERGGGIALYGGAALDLRHSTITLNKVTESGSGIYAAAGTQVEISHSIVAGNIIRLPGGNDLGPIDFYDSPGHDIWATTTPTVEYSLIGDGVDAGLPFTWSELPDDHGNFIGSRYLHLVNPRLSPLADNGGPTRTHALLPDSLAINHGLLYGNNFAGSGPVGVPAYDQRGEPFERIVGGRIDIGAFECQTPTDLNLVVDTLADESDGDYSRGDLSLREAIELANIWPGLDTIYFDTDSLMAAIPASELSPPPTINLTLGELRITDELIINGPGADFLVINAQHQSRVFNIENEAGPNDFDVVVRGLTITGGSVVGNDEFTTDQFHGGGIRSTTTGQLTIDGCTIVDNRTTGDHAAGGGVYAKGSALIVNSVIRNNQTDGFLGKGAGVYSDDNLTLQSTSVLQNQALGLYSFGGGVSALRSVTCSSSYFFENSTNQGHGGGIASTNVTLNDCYVQDNTGASGGIFAGGRLTLNGSFVSGNTSTGHGGGIYATGRVTLNDSVVTGNTAAMRGGGIYSRRSALTLNRSIVSGNHANDDGGGIYIARYSTATAIVTKSTISDNSTNGSGGGIFSYSSQVQLRDSTISGNHAAENGGGICSYFTIFIASVTVDQSTISGNSAGGAGGGIWAHRATLRNSTVTLNSAATAGGGVLIEAGALTITDTIVAANTAPLGRDFTGLLNLQLTVKNSLVGSNANTGLAASINAPSANGNLVGGPTLNQRIDPRLGPLADNDGPTQTHALLSDSRAINAGDPTAKLNANELPFHDQRGAPFIRVYGGRIDIGAVEWMPAGFLPGDFNTDGRVDALDYTVWRNAIETDIAPSLVADGDGDSKVTQLEFDIWRNNYGATSDDLPSPPVNGLLFAAAENIVAPSSSNSADRQVLAIDGDLTPRPIHRMATERFARSSAPAERRDAALLAWNDRRFDADDQPAETSGSRTHCDEGNDADHALELAFAQLGGIR